MQASEALKNGETRAMAAKPATAAEKDGVAATPGTVEDGSGVAESPSSADGGQKRPAEGEKPSDQAPEKTPTAKKAKRAQIEEAPKPLTKELPEVSEAPRERSVRDTRGGVRGFGGEDFAYVRFFKMSRAQLARRQTDRVFFFFGSPSARAPFYRRL